MSYSWTGNPSLSANENECPVRAVFNFTSVESLLSKASGSKNVKARSAGIHFHLLALLKDHRR
jgi:hypothetical protein